MNNIVLIPSKDLPYFPGVNFDFVAEKCMLYEESYMEEPYKFYKPLIDWLKEYFVTKDCLFFEFKLTYFNTSTSKMIIELLEVMKTNKDKGKKIVVRWYILYEDPDLVSEIQDFENDSDMPIEIIENYK